MWTHRSEQGVNNSRAGPSRDPRHITPRVPTPPGPPRLVIGPMFYTSPPGFPCSAFPSCLLCLVPRQEAGRIENRAPGLFLSTRKFVQRAPFFFFFFFFSQISIAFLERKLQTKTSVTKTHTLTYSLHVEYCGALFIGSSNYYNDEKFVHASSETI